MKKTIYIMVGLIIVFAVFIVMQFMGSRPNVVISKQINLIQEEILSLSGKIESNKLEWKKYEDIQQNISKETKPLIDKKNELELRKKSLESYLGINKTKPINAVQAENIKNYKYIVIHHTANYTSLENEMLGDFKKFGRYPYHYYIDVDGTVKQVADESINVGSTQNAEVNLSSIQIALIGNFNVVNPSEKQYASLRNLIASIASRHIGIEIKLHREVGKTACPGKYFNPSLIR